MTSLSELLNTPHVQRAGIQLDKKVTAIKQFRDRTRIGLKEAKDIIELVMDIDHTNVAHKMQILQGMLQNIKFQVPIEIYTFIQKISIGQDYNDSQIVNMTCLVFKEQMDQEQIPVGKIWETLDEIWEDRRANNQF